MYGVNKLLCLTVFILAPSLGLAKNSEFMGGYAGSGPVERYSGPADSEFKRLQIAERGDEQQREQRLREQSNSPDRRWEDLTPRQREEIKKRQEQYEAMPTSDKDRVKRAREQYRELPPERRKELRERWERMNPESRSGRARNSRDRNPSRDRSRNRR